MCIRTSLLYSRLDTITQWIKCIQLKLFGLLQLLLVVNFPSSGEILSQVIQVYRTPPLKMCKTKKCQSSSPVQWPYPPSPCSVTAVSYSMICATLPSATAVREYAHLSGLELADFTGRIKNKCVDWFYWKFVTGEVRRGVVGSVAICSTLGWLLSGSIGPSQFAGDTCTHLIFKYSWC